MTWTEPAYEALARLLGVRTGLAFPPDRRPAVEQGIRRAMGRAGVVDPARYCARVEADDALFDDLVGELTIGETYFFREPDQFRFLRRAILPEFRRRRGEDHVFRAWSAGCASGEEAYSLAMIFEEEGLGDRAHLLATDLSPAALAKARQASYGPWSLRGEGASAALPHLDQRDGRYTVKEPIRRRVAFEQLNLALDVYPSHATRTLGLDLILCRNVLIYFDRATVRAVAGRLCAALGPGGWLITASSDPPLADEAPFEPVVTDLGVFYRRGDADPDAGLGPAVAGAWLVDPLALALGPPATGESAGLDGDVLPPSPVGAPAPDDRPRWHEVEAATGVVVATGDPSPSPSPEAGGVLASAREDLAEGRYAQAAERLGAVVGVAGAAALRVRALANLDPEEAERACAEAVERHPLDGELHYLRAVLLHGLGRDLEATRAARRVLYLDRSLAIAHFLLGAILRRRGDRAGAWRAFRNARDLCANRPAAEVVALSDGEPAGRLAESASLQMARLGPGEDRP